MGAMECSSCHNSVIVDTEEVMLALGIVLSYMGLLYFGAIIVPGIGLSGQLLAQVPGNFLDWAHAPGYGILALLLTRGLQRRAWPLAYALPVAAAALVFGLWTEVFQGSIQGRESNVDDLVVDAIGIGIAATMMLSATVRNRIVLRPCLDSFLSFWRAGSLASLVRRVKLARQIR
jgi:hypothetical protein